VEALGELVISGCNRAIDFEVSDHASYAVAHAIDVGVPRLMGGLTTTIGERAAQDKSPQA
jgi:hypothetical protein